MPEWLITISFVSCAQTVGKTAERLGAGRDAGDCRSAP